MLIPPRKWILAVSIVLAGLLLDAGSAWAVPVFARRYETSCQTCHVAFPKLTPFGEAFRRNGYRWPAGEDEDASKDEPIALGHEAHKKVFPNAVWPGQIPGGIPLAVQTGSTVRFAPNRDAQVDFASVGANVGLNFATALDDTFSVWAGASLHGDSSGAAEAELERVMLVVQPFDGPILNIRVGRFEAGVSGFTIHRTLGFAPWYLTTPVRDAPFTIDPAQVGIEANGIVAGRIGYAVGLVEGAGILNTPKDGYARVSYKLGGMQPDGVGGATETEPWRETSVEVGAFGYYGQERIGVLGVAEQDNRFGLGGADVNFLWRDLNILAAFAMAQNRRPTLAEPREQAESWHVFAQADYVVFPWLIPTVRFEHRDIAGATGDRISGGVYALWRANIRSQVLVSVADEGTGFDLEQILAGINLAF